MAYRSKEHAREAKAAWYLANRERLRAKAQGWREANREKHLAYNREWAKQNRERCRRNKAAWRARKKKAKAIADRLLKEATTRAQVAIRGYAGTLKPNHF